VANSLLKYVEMIKEIGGERWHPRPRGGPKGDAKSVEVNFADAGIEWQRGEIAHGMLHQAGSDANVRGAPTGTSHQRVDGPSVEFTKTIIRRSVTACELAHTALNIV
jgi:hypothetical protein